MLARIGDWFGFGEHGHSHAGHGGHHHPRSGQGGHGHTHGVIDPSIASTERGIWAISWSFVILAVTALVQLAVVYLSNSIALLADTIHNIGDATTAIPLWIAFRLARRPPSPTFPFGLRRTEDLAGLLIVLIILFSALVAGYQAIARLIDPQPIEALGWLAAAGVIGFLGNEAVAVFRIRVGRQMNSAALIADGYHARTDGLTSLAVVVGALGVWLGYPLADPIIGLVITIAILGIVWQSGKAILTRMLDGVEPGTLEEIRHAAEHVPGIARVVDARARWLGHWLHADVAIAVDETRPLSEANGIARRLDQELKAHLPSLGSTSIRFAGAGLEAVDSTTAVVRHPYEGDRHAPDPFHVRGELAEGVLAIVHTPAGERMRLTMARHVPDLTAVVAIDRGATLETLILLPTGHLTLESREAPAEPHAFSAELRLASRDRSEVLPFRMEEPEGHAH